MGAERGLSGYAHPPLERRPSLESHANLGPVLVVKSAEELAAGRLGGSSRLAAARDGIVERDD
jgi:hypothetical protein